MSKKLCPFKLACTLDWLMNFLYAYAIISLIFPSVHPSSNLHPVIHLSQQGIYTSFIFFHSFTQAYCRVSQVQQKTCSLGEQRTRFPSILTLSWRILEEPPGWKIAAEPQKEPGFLASGGEEFNLGPVTRLDHSELLNLFNDYIVIIK